MRKMRKIIGLKGCTWPKPPKLLELISVSTAAAKSNPHPPLQDMLVHLRFHPHPHVAPTYMFSGCNYSLPLFITCLSTHQHKIMTLASANFPTRRSQPVLLFIQIALARGWCFCFFILNGKKNSERHHTYLDRAHHQKESQAPLSGVKRGWFFRTKMYMYEEFVQVWIYQRRSTQKLSAADYCKKGAKVRLNVQDAS